MEANIFKLHYNAKGDERKRLVQAIGEITRSDIKYLGAPTFAYNVDYFTIDKNGTVSFEDRADREEIKNLIEKLESNGFVVAAQCESENPLQESDNEPRGAVESQDEDLPAENENALTGEIPGLVVEMPLDSVTVGNLTALLEAKGKLIKKALGIDNIEIKVTEETVKFPWFSELPDADTVKAYTHFISALCKLSRELKRVNCAGKVVDNEKYAFRCFLLRLGFVGSEYKEERKILLKNLEGSSAFKNGGKNDEVSE